MNFIGNVIFVGCFLLISVASSYLPFLGVSAESEFQVTAHNVNQSEQRQLEAPFLNMKKRELSNRPSFQATALSEEGDSKPDRWNQIHSSFVESVTGSTSNKDEESSSNILPSDSATDLVNGFTDTGQVDLLSQVVVTSTPRDADDLSEVHNETDAVTNTTIQNQSSLEDPTILAASLMDHTQLEEQESKTLSPTMEGEAGVSLVMEGEAGVFATMEGEVGVFATMEGEVGVFATMEVEGGVSATVEGDVGVPATTEEEAGESATTEGEAGESAISEGEAGESAISEGKAGESPAKRLIPFEDLLKGGVEQAPDDIPSFSEWAQKQMEDAERKKAHNASVLPALVVPLKLRSKNYASPDCGAKIVAANPEAVSANSVLSPSRDEYLLNPCLNRVWLVIELCDSIQVKKIDIANFELFSSSPKEFSVSVSDRFPTRDWRNVGQFTANDVRDVQSYNLEPHMFGKFVKVEVNSHYGSEHFCPVSLLRVYGTSVLEVLETEEEVHHSTGTTNTDHEDDDEALLESGDTPRNLYGIARDAVKSIVKAAEALVIRVEPTAHTAHNSTTSLVSATPAHSIICVNCSEDLFHRTFDLLEQHHTQLYAFIRLPFVKDAIHSGPICVQYGLDFGRRRPTTFPLRQDPGDYLSSLFPPHYMAALCNILAMVEKKAVLNISHELNNVTICEPPSNMIVPPGSTCSVSSPSIISSHPPLSHTHLITPTRTLNNTSPEPDVLILTSTDTTGSPLVEDKVVVSSLLDILVLEPTGTINEDTNTTEEVPEPLLELVTDTHADSIGEVSEEDSITDPLDSLLSELKELDSTPATVTTTPPLQKESVFMRLTNRIKALERNMSLSSQYLEELSRRYKRQVEEMSRTLNRTLASVELETRHREEREKRGEQNSTQLQQQLNTLTAVVDKLMTDRDSWQNKITLMCQHLLLMTLQVVVFLGVKYFWMNTREERESREESRRGSKLEGQPERRKSVDGVSGHRSPTARRKRPSEVALNITGTYSQLLITESPMAAVDGVWSLPKPEPKRRKRKKRDVISKSISGGFLLDKQPTSQPSDNCVGESGRRASLSELTTISIPGNSVQHDWTQHKVERDRGEAVTEDAETDPVEECTVDVETHSPQKLSDVWKKVSVIKVPKQSASAEAECEKRNGSLKVETGAIRRLSSPAFMKTAASVRATRHVSEEPQLNKHKSDNWEFWHTRKSSQINLVPTSQHELVETIPVTETAPTKKSSGGLKKMVKRFF